MTAVGVLDGGRVLVRLDDGETRILLSLSRQLSGMLEDVGNPSSLLDPAMTRLFPDAYRDDPEASDEFRRYTRRDLASGKVDSASVVQAGLAGSSADAVTAAEGGRSGDIVLDAADGWSWLRHLTDLRLTLAARLGVTDDPDAFDAGPDPDASEEEILTRGLFDWIGYLQELMILALEEAAALSTAATPESDDGGTASPPR